MEAPRNGFKAALSRIGPGFGRESRPQIGLWLALADAYPAEICAGAGFDWVLIDGEHAPNDLRSILAQLQVLAAYPAHPIVRPPIGEVHLIKQLLDIGAQSLMIPMVDSAEQARRLVSAVTYPPAGIRGVGSALGRASRWNGIPGYLENPEAEICLIVQVETVEGLRNLDSIAAVDGVDGVFLGPSDLSASMGHRGSPTHPDVVGAIEDAIGRIHAAGKAAGVLANDETFARRYMAAGVDFIAVGSDVGLLARASRELAVKLKGPVGA
jgi:4-hydroxy-2-oxoheptanedioate aldolase